MNTDKYRIIHINAYPEYAYRILCEVSNILDYKVDGYECMYVYIVWNVCMCILCGMYVCVCMTILITFHV